MISRRAYLVGVMLWAVLCAMVVRPAAAQEGHGWFVLDTTSKEAAKKATIVHLPPPDQLSPRGSVRVVQGLTRAPERLAWSARTLFILMPAERVAEEEMARRAYSIAATPGMMSGWEYIPVDRPETLPTLTGKWGARDLEVVGFAATPGAPVVLMQRTNGSYLLVLLAGTEWVGASLPWEQQGGEGAVGVAAPSGADRCRLITTPASFGILIERAGTTAADWSVASAEDLRAVPAEGATGVELHWSTRQVRADPPPSSGAKARSDSVYCIENQLIRVTRGADEAVISVLRASDEYVVATVPGVGPRARIAPVDGNPGFLAFLSEAPAAAPVAPDPGPEPEIAYRLVEVTTSGRVLYDGPAKQGGPVSIREIQLLSALLVMVMAAVVVFVLRPDKVMPANAVKLPSGCVPAETGRRFMASMVDLGVSWVIASLVLQVDLADLARPDVLIGSPRGWQAGLTAIGITIAIGIVMEWQLGFTVGKMLLGCRVLGVHEEPAKPEEDVPASQVATPHGIQFRAAVWRNIAKWMPWNVVEFLATGRQRPWADRVSGSIVVVLDGSEQEGEQ